MIVSCIQQFNVLKNFWTNSKKMDTLEAYFNVNKNANAFIKSSREETSE